MELISFPAMLEGRAWQGRRGRVYGRAWRMGVIGSRVCLAGYGWQGRLAG